MTIITLDRTRDGLDGFPADHDPIARDDLGDILAVDREGQVWSFAHGMGDWKQKTRAFASVAQVEEFIAFQHELEVPDDEDLPALQDRKKRIQAFGKGQTGAPYLKEAVRDALEELRDAIEDRRFWTSKKGMSIAARQALGARCEEALREGGAPGRWMIRPHVEEPRALVAVGRFAAPWTEARVKELLHPILGECILHCREAPPSW